MITLSKPLMHDPVLPCSGAVLIQTDSSVNVQVPWGQAWSFLSLWPSAQWLLSKCLLNRDFKRAFARMNKWINVSLVLTYCNRKLFCLLRDVFIYDLSFFLSTNILSTRDCKPKSKGCLILLFYFSQPWSQCWKKNSTDFVNTSWGIEPVSLTSNGSHKLYRRRNWSVNYNKFYSVSVLLHITVFLLFCSCSSLFL